MKLQQHGHRVEVHDSGRLVADINYGAWLVDCECGAGNATGPDWKIALCFTCGAVHKVSFPKSYRAIEKVLIKRPRTENRNWIAGEKLTELRAENRAHGLEAA